MRTQRKRRARFRWSRPALKQPHGLFLRRWHLRRQQSALENKSVVRHGLSQHLDIEQASEIPWLTLLVRQQSVKHCPDDPAESLHIFWIWKFERPLLCWWLPNRRLWILPINFPDPHKKLEVWQCRKRRQYFQRELRRDCWSRLPQLCRTRNYSSVWQYDLAEIALRQLVCILPYKQDGWRNGRPR